jgi:hypothetical protein
MEASKLNYPFAAPVVSIADPVDGLLQTVDLNQPVPVSIVVWDAARPGYFVQLKLDDELVGDIRTFTEADKPGDVVVLKLNEQLLQKNGRYKVSYLATNNENRVSENSPITHVEIDRTSPGTPLLAHIIFPTVTLGNNLTGQIAGYAGMQRGDRIQTVCNGMKGPIHTVVAEELLDTPIRIVFEREFLYSLASSSVLLEYFITDRAGNVSIMSLPISLTIQA